MKALAFALMAAAIAAGVVGICYTIMLYDQNENAHEDAMAQRGWCKKRIEPERSAPYFIYKPCVPETPR
jgi:hypothetical protein